VTVATAGDYGEPRPALVVQSDLFAAIPSVVVCPLTTTKGKDAIDLAASGAPQCSAGRNCIIRTTR